MNLFDLFELRKKDHPLMSQCFLDVEDGENVIFVKQTEEPHTVVAHFGYSLFPGSHRVGIVVSHDVHVVERFRKRHVGQFLLRLREEAFKQAGYTLILCTVSDDNEAQQILLTKEGWKVLTTYTSLRKGHSTYLMGKEINDA